MTRWWGALGAVMGLAVAVQAGAQDSVRGVRIGLQYGAGTQPGVAVLEVKGGARGDSVRALLLRDLDFGDRVRVIGRSLAELPPVSGPPNYALFARLGVQGIVQATLTPTGALHVAVHDVAAQGLLQVQDFPLRGEVLSPEWRLAVHAAADEVERWLTGTRGIAATRIAFVRGGRLWTVDSDGANPTPVGNEAGLSPAWHPTGRYLAFARPTAAGYQIALRDLQTGSTRQLTGTSSGTNLTPVFSPDGTTLVYAYGDGDGTDLFTLDVFNGGPRQRLSAGRGSDNASPSFSPDGRRVAFTSGRVRNPEIYISDADGSNVDLLTTTGFGDQQYRSNPAWSPDGRLVAFQSQIDGRFQIMTISLRDRSVRQYTSDSANEDPFWAPDGRHLVFTSRRTGSEQLWVLDTESNRLRQLTFGAPARHGAWSPPLAGR
jgi:TolB protein